MKKRASFPARPPSSLSNLIFFSAKPYRFLFTCFPPFWVGTSSILLVDDMADDFLMVVVKLNGKLFEAFRTNVGKQSQDGL